MAERRWPKPPWARQSGAARSGGEFPRPAARTYSCCSTDCTMGARRRRRCRRAGMPSPYTVQRSASRAMAGPVSRNGPTVHGTAPKLLKLDGGRVPIGTAIPSGRSRARCNARQFAEQRLAMPRPRMAGRTNKSSRYSPRPCQVEKCERRGRIRRSRPRPPPTALRRGLAPNSDRENRLVDGHLFGGAFSYSASPWMSARMTGISSSTPG